MKSDIASVKRFKTCQKDHFANEAKRLASRKQEKRENAPKANDVFNNKKNRFAGNS